MQYGLLAVDGLTFDGCRSGGMPLVQISDDNPTGRAVTHLRNVKTVNWNDNKSKALANLGGGPRPQPKTEKGVPVYFHDWYGPGRTALVSSLRSPEYKARPDAYRSDAPLTGDESRAAEVTDAAFPAFPTPADDLPPMTVVTQALRKDGKLLVRGTCIDNGAMKRVAVNGRDARATAANFAEWEIVLDGGATKIEAKAEDAAGNVERTPAVIAGK